MFIAFYPSITEELLNNSFIWARSLIKILKIDKEMVFTARCLFLFLNDQPWVKQENPAFDVTIGSFDGAEVAEFVGLFLLHKLTSIMHLSDFALYRDDGLCALRCTKRSIDDIRKKIEVLFKNVKLQIETPPIGPAKSLDFLDLNVNLKTGFHPLIANQTVSFHSYIKIAFVQNPLLMKYHAMLKNGCPSCLATN